MYSRKKQSLFFFVHFYYSQIMRIFSRSFYFFLFKRFFLTNYIRLLNKTGSNGRLKFRFAGNENSVTKISKYLRDRKINLSYTKAFLCPLFSA